MIAPTIPIRCSVIPFGKNRKECRGGWRRGNFFRHSTNCPFTDICEIKTNKIGTIDTFYHQ
jgi:hypothetical protein